MSVKEIVVLIVLCFGLCMGIGLPIVKATSINLEKKKYTIQAYGDGTSRVYFHDVTELDSHSYGGVWFNHGGKRKYISGNIIIEEQ